METKALRIVWRVDALVSDFHVVAFDGLHRLPQALFGQLPVRTAIQELDGDSQDLLTVKVPGVSPISPRWVGGLGDVPAERLAAV